MIQNGSPVHYVSLIDMESALFLLGVPAVAPVAA